MFLEVLLLGQLIKSVYDKKIKKKLVNDCCFEEYDCQVQKKVKGLGVILFVIGTALCLNFS